MYSTLENQSLNVKFPLSFQVMTPSHLRPTYCNHYPQRHMEKNKINFNAWLWLSRCRRVIKNSFAIIYVFDHLSKICVENFKLFTKPLMYDALKGQMILLCFLSCVVLSCITSCKTIKVTYHPNT